MNYKKIMAMIKYLLNIPIWWLSYIIPRNKNIWVFGSWFGEKYGDNSKYLFEYINKNCPEIKAIWLTKNNETLKFVRQKGYRAYKAYSFMGYFYTLMAAYGFVSTGYGDINFVPTANMKMINLWHGTGGLKKCMMDDDITGMLSKPSLYKKLKKLFFPFAHDRYYSVIATSEVMVGIFKSAFRGLTKRVDVIGQPRCDSFYQPVPESEFNKYLQELKKENKTIGIYMPTHRKEGKVNFAEFIQSELPVLNKKMNEMNIILLIKLHYYHLKNMKSLQQNFSNIIFVKDEDIEQDIYNILPITDFLISDYSSIYADYLHLNKPIIFFPFDIDDYIKSDRDFYMNYDEITPGDKVYNWSDLYNSINNLILGKDTYINKRQEIHNLFNLYQDGRNCERVVEWIRSLDKKGR